MKFIFKLLCALALVGAMIAGAERARASAMPPALADLAAKVLPAVVSIASTDPIIDNKSDDDDDDDNGPGGGDDNGSFRPDRTADTSSTAGSVLPPPKAEEALGSGFVIDPSGFILTNAHVIAGASSVTVTFQDGTILPATIVGRDKGGDLAVLKVDPSHRLVAVQFGDSGKLRVGDWVLAIGNPFGLPGSTSAGIVSALDRNIDEDKYDDFIQTDATINRGNSGGPLFDMSGHVVGINAAIYSPSGGSVGIGFAIPSAMAAPVAAALMKTGAMQRGWLGVSTQEVTPDIARVFGLADTSGALIGGTSPHGPADGKLQSGDDLVALGGAPIKNPRSLMIRTAEIPAGSTVPAQFWRDGSLQSATLTVTPPPVQLDDTQISPPAAAPGNVGIAGLGLNVSAVPSPAGLQVMSVQPNGPAAAAGIVADDTVEQLNGAPIDAPTDLQRQVAKLADTHQPAVLLISGYAGNGNDPGPRWLSVYPKK